MALAQYLRKLPPEVQLDLLVALKTTGFKQFVAYSIRGIEYDMVNLATSKSDEEFAADYRLLQRERDILKEFSEIEVQLNEHFQLEPTADGEGD